jgi:hypothetical protein
MPSNKQKTTFKNLSRFEKDLAPIQLELLRPRRHNNGDSNDDDDDDGQHQQRRLVPIQLLEDSIKDCLNWSDDNDNCNDDMDGPTVEYPMQADASWLHCRRSKKTTATLLGFQEEEEDDQESSMVEILTLVSRRPDTHITANNVSDDDNTLETSPNYVPGPHSEWRRVDWDPPSQQQQQQHKQPLLVHWVDLLPLTINNKDWLPTLGSIVHFLRSLLDTDHLSSPWSRSSTTGNGTQDTNNDNASSSRPDCVVLLVHQLPARFQEVRVSDVCPSWYVHTICRVRVDAASAPNNPFLPWEQPPLSQSQQMIPATLVVYRRLPPRDHLSFHHPVHGQPATAGCLWETCTVAPEQQQQQESIPPLVQFVRMVAPPYVSCHDEYPGLVEGLLQPDTFGILRQEALTIAHWTAWPESQHYRARSSTDKNATTPDNAAPWTVLPLCHCFPAHDVSHRQWIPITCSLVPRTVALLQEHLGDTLRTALFSRLDPACVLEAHTGWQDLANFVVRLHIPLSVPAVGDLCGTWVDGCVETHAEGRPVVFDDSKTHRAFNYCDGEERIVLILDLARPSALPVGTATGGHSEELDQFIEKMGLGGK